MKAVAPIEKNVEGVYTETFGAQDAADVCCSPDAGGGSSGLLQRVPLWQLEDEARLLMEDGF